MLRIMRTQDKNRQGYPIFLLQFFNVLYMAVTYCAKFEKNLESRSFSSAKFEKNLESRSFSRELPQIKTAKALTND